MSSHNQYIFKRYEKKHLLSDKKYTSLRQRLQGRLEVDKYGVISICNIYFDTPQHLLIRNSIDKPIYKEKLRLRSYGTPADNDMVFIELKKKYKGIVYKRRVSLELMDAEHYLYDGIPVNHTSQVIKEIDWVLHFYQQLIPSMYISYNRVALFGLEQSDLRITFDSNIIWREEDLRLGSGTWGNQLLEDGWKLMEIKIPGVMPLWLSHILDELDIYPVSFSKYGMAYQQSEQRKHKEIRKGEYKYA